MWTTYIRSFISFDSAPACVSALLIRLATRRYTNFSSIVYKYSDGRTNERFNLYGARPRNVPRYVMAPFKLSCNCCRRRLRFYCLTWRLDSSSTYAPPKKTWDNNLLRVEFAGPIAPETSLTLSPFDLYKFGMDCWGLPELFPKESFFDPRSYYNIGWSLYTGIQSTIILLLVTSNAHWIVHH